MWDNGHQIVGHTISARDWQLGSNTADAFALMVPALNATLRARFPRPAIHLQHDFYPSSAAAVASIIDVIQDAGYAIVPMPSCIHGEFTLGTPPPPRDTRRFPLTHSLTHSHALQAPHQLMSLTRCKSVCLTVSHGLAPMTALCRCGRHGHLAPARCPVMPQLRLHGKALLLPRKPPPMELPSHMLHSRRRYIVAPATGDSSCILPLFDARACEVESQPCNDDGTEPAPPVNTTDVLVLAHARAPFVWPMRSAVSQVGEPTMRGLDTTLSLDASNTTIQLRVQATGEVTTLQASDAGASLQLQWSVLEQPDGAQVTLSVDTGSLTATVRRVGLRRMHAMPRRWMH